MKHKSPLIVALDVPDLKAAEKLVKQLSGHVTAFKIGSQLFTRYGPDAVAMVKRHRCEVFLDLKFHDIPHTVARAVEQAVGLGVWMLTLHAAGGAAMLRGAARIARADAARLGADRPKLMAVTVLTSLDDHMLREELGVSLPASDWVCKLAGMAYDAGTDGVVASAQELSPLRAMFPKGRWIIVTPGIRSSRDARGDQKRTATAREAIHAGADFLVVGRPITEAPDPARAAQDILEEIA